MVRPKPGGAQSEVNILLSGALCATYVLYRTMLLNFFLKINMHFTYVAYRS